MPADAGLWEFANRLYAAPGVSAACLQLQDESGVDVCVLMLLLWLSRRQRSVRVTQVQMMLRTSQAWRTEVVLPLRTLRRRLKTAPTLVEARPREAFRETIAKAELHAEHLQLDALENLFGESRICDAAASVRMAATVSLSSYQTAITASFPAATAETLIAATEVTSHE